MNKMELSEVTMLDTVTQYLSQHAILEEKAIIKPDGTTVLMDRIDNTIYLIDKNRETIYDISYVRPYPSDKIPANHIVMNDHLFRIAGTITKNDPARMYEVLLCRPVYFPKEGYRFYLDGELILNNVQARNVKRIRNRLLSNRKDGKIPVRFKELKIVDHMDKVTLFTFPRDLQNMFEDLADKMGKVLDTKNDFLIYSSS